MFAATWVLGGSVYVLLAPLRAHVRRQRLAWHEKKWRRQEGLDPDVPGAF